MRRTCSRTIGDVRTAIEDWRRSFVRAALEDDGRQLLNRWPDRPVADCAAEEVDLFLTNLSFCLLDHRVPLWAQDADPVSEQAWERLRAILRGSRYGEDRRRYVLELHGVRERPLRMAVSSLSSRPALVRVGDVYAAMPFRALVVRDRERPWTRHSAFRSGRAVLDELCRDQALSLEVTFHGHELRLDVRTDHDRLEARLRIEVCAETAAGALGRRGFLCGEPIRVAGNAARIPMARRERLPDALFLLPVDHPGVGDDVVLLPTAPVMLEYGVVIAPGPRRPLMKAAERAAVQLLSFEELLLDDNRERLRKAARSLPA